LALGCRRHRRRGWWWDSTGPGAKKKGEGWKGVLGDPLCGGGAAYIARPRESRKNPQPVCRRQGTNGESAKEGASRGEAPVLVLQRRRGNRGRQERGLGKRGLLGEILLGASGCDVVVP